MRGDKPAGLPDGKRKLLETDAAGEVWHGAADSRPIVEQAEARAERIDRVATVPDFRLIIRSDVHANLIAAPAREELTDPSETKGVTSLCARAGAAPSVRIAIDASTGIPM